MKYEQSSYEIIRFAHDEIKSTHPPSKRISSTIEDFIGVNRFISPDRADLVKKPRFRVAFLEAPSRIELEMAILQTAALPLGYGAI